MRINGEEILSTGRLGSLRVGPVRRETGETADTRSPKQREADILALRNQIDQARLAGLLKDDELEHQHYERLAESGVDLFDLD